MMKKEKTPEDYRKAKLGQFDVCRDWVTKNYDVFWRLAHEASIITDEPFRIETLYGDFQFIKKIKLSD